MGRPGPSQKLTVAKIDRRKNRLRLTLQLRSSQRQASTETSNPEPRKEENNERSFFFFLKRGTQVQHRRAGDSQQRKDNLKSSSLYTK